jgi:hypothetical protein
MSFHSYEYHFIDASFLYFVLFILASFSFSYFLYLHGSLWLALSVLITFNGVATYFFFKASHTVSDGKR